MLTSLQTGSNRAEACLARLQNLNPMVEVSFEACDVADKPDEFFRDFDVAVVVSCDRALLCRVDAACRAAGVKFYSGDVVGYFGWAFADLGRHDFTEEVPNKIPDVEGTKGTETAGEPEKKKAKKAEEMETEVVERTVEASWVRSSSPTWK